MRTKHDATRRRRTTIWRSFQIGFLGEGMLRLSHVVPVLLIASAVFAGAPPDALTLGSASAPPGGTAQVPVYLRDGSSTPLGNDAGAGNRIQGIGFKVNWSSPASVASVTFVRAGVTAALIPRYERTIPSAGAIGYVVSFAESSDPIPLTPAGAGLGDRIGTLLVRFTSDAAEGTVVTLSVDPATATLSNEAGTNGETTANGWLSTVSGAATVQRFATATSLSSSGSPSLVGDTVTFTATVSSEVAGTITGTVTFRNGGAMLGTSLLSGGTASYSTSALPAGAQSITATFDGNTNYAPSTSSAITQQVNTPPFGAPANVVATATSASQVVVMWNPVGSAVFYEVFRSANGLGGFAAAGISNGTLFTDDTVSGSTTYLYKVQAIDGSSTRSAFSAIDAATTIIFMDEPIAAGVTSVKAIHLEQLRAAVNAFRATAGRTAYAFADAATPTTPIRALHVEQLRAALFEARNALMLPSVAYIDQPLPAGMTIKGAHFQQIRDAVK